MKRHLILALVCIAIIAGSGNTGAKKKGKASNEFSKAVTDILKKPDKVILVSLFPDPKQLDPADGFHGYRELGRVEVVDKDKKTKTRTDVLKALRKGVKDSRGNIAKCFLPRHGLIVTQKGKDPNDTKTVELVICYECLHMYVYYDKNKTMLTTTALPGILFNRVLREAKIKLPPQAK